MKVSFAMKVVSQVISQNHKLGEEMIGLGAIRFRYHEPDELPAGDIPTWIKQIQSHPAAYERWRALEMPWGEVFGPVDLADLRQVAHWTDLFLGMLQRTFGVPLFSPVAVRVSTAAELNRYCIECGGGSGTQAFYNDEKSEIAVGLAKSKAMSGLQFNLAHETTHAYMDLAIGFLGPPWFAEGLADYFGHFYLRRGYPVPGAIMPELLYGASSVIDRIKLSELFRYGWKEFYEDKEAHYDVSLAFIHYLISRIGLKELFEIVFVGRNSDLLRYEADFRKELEKFTNPPPPPGYRRGHLISH